MAYQNKIGMIQPMHYFFDGKDPEWIDRMADGGVETLQVLLPGGSDLLDEAHAEEILRMTEGKLKVTSVWGGWSGPAIWNFTEGPTTLGLVPEQYREQRMKDLKKDADFAAWLGVPDLATHVGFVPEQPCYPGYTSLVDAISEIADYCGERGMHFNFETGQETPVTLMRVIQDSGRTNLGVNLDPANLIMYGRANPIDAAKIYGDKIRGVHAKDGDYPKGNFNLLGNERFVSEGSVNYPLFIKTLLEGGYTGDLYIEREIEEPQRTKDVLTTVHYLKDLMK